MQNGLDYYLSQMVSEKLKNSWRRDQNPRNIVKM